MIKSKKQMFIVIGLFALVMLLGEVTYAFFNYTRTGAANTITVGRIAFVTRQTETINLTNLFPIDPTVTGIMDDATKVGTLEIEIEGDTDYSGGVEYLISTVNSSVTTSTGKTVPISLDVEVTDLGTPSDTYFTARNSKNATIYKRLSGNEVIGDQQLLVGYIKPNTQSGTAEGVDGKITIKAYFDENKIAISDTYDGTESDVNGTTNNWVNNRVVLTTDEWNSLSTNGISFQVKVEANEGIWVEEPIYNTMRANAVMDNIQSTNVSASTGIDFSKISGDTDSDGVIDNGEGLYVRAGTENDAYPIVYYRGNVNNNVYFAGKCWQIIRTTETGGTKLIYNGENTGTAEAPACEPAAGTDRQITLNIEGTDTNTFPFSGTGLNNSPAYNGYTYNTPVYSATNGNYASGSKFGNSVTYDGTNYTITDVSDTLDANHHYTCGTVGTTTCSSVRYYFSYFTASGNNYYMYFTLTNGKKIEDVVRESLENGTVESNAKDKIETWYAENISNTEYNAKIEDAVYCNDRSIYQLGGLNPNGGTLTAVLSTNLMYSGYKRNYVDFNPSTRCVRREDSFTKESSNGNGLLDYPVGLITIDEMAMAGGKLGTANTNFYLYTGANYWSLSPGAFSNRVSANEFYVYSSGSLVSTYPGRANGLRPVVSLKLGTSISEGDGTSGSPYIIK